jgi:hypothetical protein
LAFSADWLNKYNCGFAVEIVPLFGAFPNVTVWLFTNNPPLVRFNPAPVLNVYVCAPYKMSEFTFNCERLPDGAAFVATFSTPVPANPVNCVVIEPRWYPIFASPVAGEYVAKSDPLFSVNHAGNIPFTSKLCSVVAASPEGVTELTNTAGLFKPTVPRVPPPFTTFTVAPDDPCANEPKLNTPVEPTFAVVVTVNVFCPPDTVTAPKDNTESTLGAAVIEIPPPRKVNGTPAGNRTGFATAFTPPWLMFNVPNCRFTSKVPVNAPPS